MQNGGLEPPALGERRAISGYSAQYHLAARLILRALRAGQLVEVLVADPEAGTLDDLQIAGTDRLDAYQFKHSQSETPIRYGDLRAEIDRLGSGWEALREREHPNREVFAHLVSTTPAASAGPISDLDAPPPVPADFATFLARVWNGIHQGEINSEADVPAGFGAAWRELRRRTGLEDAAFVEFARRLTISYEPYVPDGTPSDPGLDPDLRESYALLLQLIVQTVASEEGIVRISREVLLERLKWTTAFSTFAVQEFRVDYARYRPNRSVRRQVEVALATHPSGYLALLGGPGTGKSYLLSDLVERRSELAARYYTYVPGSREGAEQRASGEAFLHDLVVQLEASGAVVGEGPTPQSVAALRARLRAQLEWFAEQGRRALILVDGLDYVRRSGVAPGVPTVLSELPIPPLPDGVQIVIGAQHLEGVSPEVREHLAEDGRSIEMRPLEAATVREIAGDAGVELEPDGLDLLIARANGHPLVLGTLLQGIAQEPPENRFQWLAEQPEVLDGRIETVYERYWQDFEGDPELLDLLAKMARWRQSLDPIWLAEGDTTVIRRLLPVHHHFRRERADRWFFFHESFRLFLLGRTVRQASGQEDTALGRRYSAALADRCAAAAHTDLRRFEELHHRLRAEQWAAALTLATPMWFRTQAELLRSPSAISSDVQRAFEALRHDRNSAALARLVIAASEASVRGYHLDWARAVPVALIRIGRVNEALDWLMTDVELRASKDVALEATAELLTAGYGEDARRLFELAEPRDLFLGRSLHYNRIDQAEDTLYAWANVAAVFRPDPAELIETVRTMTAESFDLRANEDLLIWRKAEITALLARRYEATGNRDAWRDMLESLAEDEAGRTYRWYLEVLAAHANDDVPELRRLAGRIGQNDGPTYFAAEAAELLLRHGERDTARAVLAHVPLPLLTEPDHRSDAGIAPFREFLLVFRTRAAAGLVDDPDEVIPWVGGNYGLWSRGRRLLVRVSQLQAYFLQGEDPPEELLSSVLDSLERDLDAGSWRSYGRSALRAARGPLFRDLVREAGVLGGRARGVIEDRMRVRYGEDRPSGWEAEARIVVPAMAESGLAEGAWGTEILDAAESSMLAGLDASSAVDACSEHADAWRALGEAERAEAAVRRAVNASFAVGYRKDTQLSDWINLAGPLLEGAEGADLALSIGTGLVGLEDTTEGDAGRYAAQDLLPRLGSHPGALLALVDQLSLYGVVRDRGEMLALGLRGLAAAQPSHVLLWALLRMVIAGSKTASEMAVRAVADQTPDGEIEMRLSSVGDLVSVQALPSTRLEWRAGIVRAAEDHGRTGPQVEIDPTDLEPGPRAPQEPYSDSSDVEIATVAQLLELDAGASYVSGLGAAVGRLAPEMNLESVHTVLEHFDSSREVYRVLGPLTERLLELGERSAAEALAMRLLAEADPMAWTPRWGSYKRRAVEVLRRIRAATLVEERAYEQLVADVAATPYLLPELAHDLPRLLRVLSGEVPAEAAGEARDHLVALLSSSEPEARPPEEVDDADSALAHLLATELLTDRPLWGEAAARSIRDLLVDRNETVSAALAQNLRADDLSNVVRVVSGARVPPTPVLAERLAAIQDPDLPARIGPWLRAFDVGGVAEGAPEDLVRDWQAPGLGEDPVVRPAEIVVIPGGREIYHANIHDFEAGTPDPTEVCPSEVSDYVVLAEVSRLIRLGWERQTEDRLSFIGRMEQSGDSYELSELWDYEEEPPWDEGRPMFHIRRRFGIGVPWKEVEVHRAAAELMGLSRVGGAPGNWMDADGRLAITRLWWRDGNLDHEPPSFDDEVGEGWLVLGTTEAVDRARSLLGGPIGRLARVERIHGGSGLAPRTSREPVS